MNEGFENFIDNDSGWFSDIELRVLDLEKGLSEWRESRTRELARPDSGPEFEPEFEPQFEPEFEPEADEQVPSHAPPFRRAGGAGARRPREFARAAGNTEHGRGHGRTSASRPRPRPAHGRAWPIDEDESLRATARTQALIDQGRRTGRARRPGRGRKIVIGSAAGLVVLTIGAMVFFRKGPSWPASVATVRSEITIACQNPNVAAEPGQVNFACGQDTSQVLWVFALLTSNDNPGYADATTGRKGLEPITPAQGGEIAWSLNLHHPYNPFGPLDSLEVAARAINNIVGGATLTAANGKPTVQPGLESKPENCARYTGSSAIISHAGFPSVCASQVTSPQGQAALASDVYKQWMPDATPVAVQNVSVLFEDADNPGDPQVQAILKTLPAPGE